MTDTPAISIPTENESSDTTALVSEPDSVCRKSAGGALVTRGKNAGQIIVSDESGSKQLVPYQGTQGGSLVVRPAPVKGEVVPYEKKQYLPAVFRVWATWMRTFVMPTPLRFSLPKKSTL